jgi:primosomal protein N' (replication factor Y)
MYYYLVAVASNKYHGQELLTYSSDAALPIGAVVTIPLQRAESLGFVVKETAKPTFKTKPLVSTLPFSPLPQQSVALLAWLLSYYPAPVGVVAQLFLPSSFPQKIKRATEEATVIAPKNDLPSITASQSNALETMSQPGSYILHGETGSGKTRVYIELAKKALANHRSAIILTPEISLTSQLAREFEKTFNPSQLIILHSQLTAATRRDIWIKLLDTSLNYIIIGPRSALFSPLKDIGLIVVDEAHELAYKQENAPHYLATRVAGKLADLHKAVLVLGSATPSIHDYHLAQARKRPVIHMSPVSTNQQSPATTVVDMRDKTNVSKSHYLSKHLLSEIKEKLSNGQQTLLFINRRGTARVTLCENCGWQAACPHCDLPLTYHHDEYLLRCHTCGITQKAPLSCPTCQSTEIILKSIGTKSVVAEIEKLFPSARVMRFDTDNRKGERLNELYKEVHSGDVDILVGTQILAKGLDLPQLGLVGVINADASLYLPDFTAQERAYQLLYQVIGRVGRSSQAQAATVIIQTYAPDNHTLKAAAAKDWQTFYETELQERSDYLFPPFCHLLKISCKRVRSETAQKNAEEFATLLANKHLAIQIDGPAPAFYEKIQNKYVWQLVIKSKRRGELLKVIQLLPANWAYDIDPVNLL